MKREFQLSDRREFLAAGVRGLAMLATLTSLRSHGAQKETANPFAYDVSRFSKTDPKLIRYKEIKRWKSPALARDASPLDQTTRSTFAPADEARMLARFGVR